MLFCSRHLLIHIKLQITVLFNSTSYNVLLILFLLITIYAGSPSSPVAVGLRRSSMQNISISVTKQHRNEAVCLTGGSSYLLSVDTVV